LLTLSPLRCRRIVFFATCAALAGCAEKPRPSAPPATPEFSADVVGGAKQCAAPDVTLTEGRTVDATMRVGNDGGWCAIAVQLDGKPYAAGLLTTSPEHGNVFIHPVGDNTRIDYTPELGFAGHDRFTVELIPGNPMIRVGVTVTP
jgi:hypothetical protein